MWSFVYSAHKLNLGLISLLLSHTESVKQSPQNPASIVLPQTNPPASPQVILSFLYFGLQSACISLKFARSVKSQQSINVTTENWTLASICPFMLTWHVMRTQLADSKRTSNNCMLCHPFGRIRPLDTSRDSFFHRGRVRMWTAYD